MSSSSSRFNKRRIVFVVITMVCLNVANSRVLTDIVIVRNNVTVQQHQRLALETSLRSKNFTCRYPQKRAVTIRDILQDELDPSDIYTPYDVVLQRCDSSAGCCMSDTLVCGLAQEEEVKVAFAVKNSITNISSVRLIAARNHTRCRCQLLSEDPPR